MDEINSMLQRALMIEQKEPKLTSFWTLGCLFQTVERVLFCFRVGMVVSCEERKKSIIKISFSLSTTLIMSCHYVPPCTIVPVFSIRKNSTYNTVYLINKVVDCISLPSVYRPTVIN